MLPSFGTQYVPLAVKAAHSCRTTRGLMNCRSTLIRQRLSRSSVTLQGKHQYAGFQQPALAFRARHAQHVLFIHRLCSLQPASTSSGLTTTFQKHSDLWVLLTQCSTDAYCSYCVLTGRHN